MTTRSRETTLTFTIPFALSEVDRPLPAGTYRVVIDKENIPGLSFLAFRRTATVLHLPAMSERGGVGEVSLVNPDELAAAIEANGAGLGKDPRPSRALTRGSRQGLHGGAAGLSA